MRVYVAGPMRGVAQFNFPAFYDAAEALRRLGHEVFNPAERDSKVGFDPTELAGDEDLTEHGFDLREALAADMEWISLHADAIALLPGWESSRGAQAEVALARALGLQVTDFEAFDRVGPVIEYSPEYTDRLTLPAGEVRVTSTTGGQKGTKPQRFDLIPAGALTLLAELYGRGAAKYEDRNWERGYDWSLSFAALNRHLWAFWSGEDIDAEMELPHLASVAFHTFALLEFSRTHPEFDNRPVAA